MWSTLSEKSGIRVELLQRVAVTLVVAGVVVAGGFLPVPFMEVPGASFYGIPRHPLTIGALGISPFAVGYVLIEGVAVLLSDGDADLAVETERPDWIVRAAVVAGVGLAIVYGLEVGAYWFSFAPSGPPGELIGGQATGGGFGTFEWIGTGASIAAGSGLYYLAAQWVSRSGIGDGFAVVFGTEILWGFVPAAGQFEDWLRSMSFQNLDVFGILGNILAVALVVLATLWAVTRYEGWVTQSSESAGEGDQSIRPDTPASTPFHAPVAGVLPFVFGLAALWLIWFGRSLFGNESMRWLQEGLETIPHATTVPFFAQELVAVLAVGALLGWYLVRRDAKRASFESEAERSRVVKRALAASLGFVGFLVVVDVFGGPLAQSLGVEQLVIGTAIAYDLSREWRFRRAFDQPVPLQQVHRTGAVGPAIERLTAAGIPTVVRGRAFRSMLRMFGSFTPHTVFIPESCRDAAASVLEKTAGRRDDAR